MDDIVVKICVVCQTEKSIDELCNKERECTEYNIKKLLKRYYDNEDDI